VKICDHLLPDGACALRVLRDRKPGKQFCVNHCHKRAGGENKPIPAVAPPTRGAGTELKRILSKIGIRQGGCSCNRRARQMDAYGIEWCEENMPTILGWLREEATRRKLPFVEVAARLVVNAAIRRAKAKG
jgi:hypothetical protein